MGGASDDALPLLPNSVGADAQETDQGMNPFVIDKGDS